MSELLCIDLFAGAGGLSEGLEEAGFKSIFASEMVEQYACTYKKNHPQAEVAVGDIRQKDAETIRASLGLEKGQLHLMAGGPPCQGFSINAPVRSTEDPRNHLFKEYLRFVEEFEPQAVLIENVPGLVSFAHGATLHAILESLNALGYGADVRILGAPYYGVPQMRWRTIVIGIRGGEVPQEIWPEPICSAPLRANFTTIFDGRSILKMPSPEVSAPFTTLREAISDLPVLENGERGAEVKDYASEPQCEYQRNMRRNSNGVYNHEAGKLSKINLERLAYIGEGDNWTNIPEELLPRGMKRARKGDHTKRYGRTRWDDISSTVLTKCDPHWGAFFHPEQNRTFTVREAARIQSFPDYYVFTGAMADQYAQVGNAVPPILAYAVGTSLAGSLKGE